MALNKVSQYTLPELLDVLPIPKSLKRNSLSRTIQIHAQRELCSRSPETGTAYSYLPPRFISLNTVTFRDPVPVRSVLHLTTLVANKQLSKRRIRMIESETDVQDGMLIQFRVLFVVRGLDKGSHKDIGTIIYSLYIEDKSDYTIIPESYEEMMICLKSKCQTIKNQEYMNLLVKAH